MNVNGRHVKEIGDRRWKMEAKAEMQEAEAEADEEPCDPTPPLGYFTREPVNPLDFIGFYNFVPVNPQ